MTSRPRVVISMGDPAGIGPEVTVKALARRGLRRRLTPLLVGDLAVFTETAARLGVALRFAAWQPPEPLPRGAIAVRTVSALPPRQRRPGRPTTASGRAAYAAVVEAVRLIQAGAAAALVTAPAGKADLAADGAAMAGHTELLARLTGAAPVCMLMLGKRLRVALATTHTAFAAIPAALSRRRVLDTILLTHATLRERLGVRRPRIGVAALNPHAGEGGLLGDEEARVIVPAIHDAARRRVDVVGPLAADSLFPQAAAGRYDAVVCMYHDQGLAPFKLLHFADGVNFTAGLPFVRTSPDHGTAYDIAGQGIADPRSMAAAAELAARLSRAGGARRHRRAA